MRPSKVVGLPVSELNALLAGDPGEISGYNKDVIALVGHIKNHQAGELRLALNRLLLQQGLNAFLSKTVLPLNQLIGDAWLRGEMRVFEEHLYSDQLTGVLRSIITTIRDPRGQPKVLLTTLPGEEHALGLLMVEATLTLSGANCVMLGVQTPIAEIVAAAGAHEADVVVLSFSSAATRVQVNAGLQQTRAALPRGVELWAGGSGVSRQRRSDEGIRLMDPLSDVVEAVNLWREANDLPLY
jgi:methanogenic corrinoid protein MtbC1